MRRRGLLLLGSVCGIAVAESCEKTTLLDWLWLIIQANVLKALFGSYIVSAIGATLLHRGPGRRARTTNVEGPSCVERSARI
jgi:hypothetical protein